MASANELREAVAARRQQLREAIEATADRWESATDGAWSPRVAAQHCIDRDIGVTGIAAAALRGEPPAPEHATESNRDSADALPLPTAADAIASLERGAAEAERVFGPLSDADLATPAELGTGYWDDTIEGVLIFAAWHLNDHAEQIATMR